MSVIYVTALVPRFQNKGISTIKRLLKSLYCIYKQHQENLVFTFIPYANLHHELENLIFTYPLPFVKFCTFLAFLHGFVQHENHNRDLRIKKGHHFPFHHFASSLTLWLKAGHHLRKGRAFMYPLSLLIFSSLSCGREFQMGAESWKGE